jgi:protease-4
MTQEEVEAVAKGRVWSGEDAKARGLIDELGGSTTALRLAKEAAKLAPDAAVELTVFPREKEPYEIVLDRLLGKHRDDDDHSVGSSSIERSLKAAQPLIQRLQMLLDNAGVLTMPAIGPIR